MGGYGIWVWPAYGMTFLIFILNFILCHTEKKRILKKKNR
ncbi:MAG: heme exporter protein CcmD [Gammaproteobacteria bacterium]|nr:heme exporter protein CcmD [Gammaproteobacteria bacterium]